MGQKQSKDRLLYQYVVNGDVEGIQFLSKQGASLEWKDKEGKTPLIVAAKDPASFGIGQTLIELGANVNAFCKGHNGGTPLHYAAKEGLDRTVALLLSNGANAFVKNHENQTPLDVARKNGRNLVVREIEGRICYFAGPIRKDFGPGLSDASGSHLSSRIIWVVVVPRSPHNPPKRPKLELVIYSTPQDAEPQKVVSLKKCKVKEPRFDHPSPTLVIFDKHTRTRYKFSPVAYNDKQQLRRLYNACKGISQVMSASSQYGAEPWDSSIQATAAATAMTANAYTQSSPFMTGRNGWGYTIGSPSPNTWRSPGRITPPMTPRNNFRVHESPRGRDSIAESWSGPILSPPHKGSQANVNPPMLQTPDRLPAAVSETVPSAPPISTDHTTAEISAKDQPDSSSCVVCWEAPVEAACIPCGHVSSCISCLKEIQGKNGVCPVCRAQIDQVVKLYGI